MYFFDFIKLTFFSLKLFILLGKKKKARQFNVEEMFEETKRNAIEMSKNNEQGTLLYIF